MQAFIFLSLFRQKWGYLQKFRNLYPQHNILHCVVQGHPVIYVKSFIWFSLWNCPQLFVSSNLSGSYNGNDLKQKVTSTVFLFVFHVQVHVRLENGLVLCHTQHSVGKLRKEILWKKYLSVVNNIISCKSVKKTQYFLWSYCNDV